MFSSPLNMMTDEKIKLNFLFLLAFLLFSIEISGQSVYNTKVKFSLRTKSAETH